MNSTETIGTRLYNLRKKQNLSQEDIAARVGVDRRTIMRYENDQCDIPARILLEYCQNFHISADYLLTGTENDPFGRINALKENLLHTIANA